MKHPIQPIVIADDGVVRFHGNKIVQHFLDTHPSCDMNTIMRMQFSDDDRRQLAQLIGYSLSGYGSLSSYVRDEDYAAAVYMHETSLDEKDSRIAALEQTISELRRKIRALRGPLEEVFDMAGDE